MRGQEQWGVTWRRRLVTIPTVYVMALVALALSPATLLGAALMAPFERRRGVALRCVGFITAYLVGEAAFLAAAGLQWLAAPGFTPRGAARLERFTARFGNAWGAYLFGCGRLFFGLRVHVSGLEALGGERPLLVFMRHASLGDTPLAPVYLGRHAGRRLRYVAKAELRKDPIFDLIGGRSRSCFVHRGSAHADREIAAICALLDDLGARDAIVIYPEGTRFSPEKRVRVLARAASHLPPELYARARAMRHVLPPRLGGPLALLEHNPGADVVFCAHAGYEGAATLRDLLDGRAIDRHVEVRFTRVPFEAIPKGREALERWLFERWGELDAWVGARLEPAAEAAAVLRNSPAPGTL